MGSPEYSIIRNLRFVEHTSKFKLLITASCQCFSGLRLATVTWHRDASAGIRQQMIVNLNDIEREAHWLVPALQRLAA